jgi:hypothetical protein
MLNTTTLFFTCPLNGRRQQVATRSLRLTPLYCNCILFLILLLTGLTAQAQDYTVSNTTDGNATNQLRGALITAGSIAGNHVVTVNAGTYNITLGDIFFGSVNNCNITINGAGAGSTIIDAGNLSRAFVYNTTAFITSLTITLNNVTVRNCKESADVFGGGAILCGGSDNNVSNFNNCIFQNNTISSTLAGTAGGAIRCSIGSLSVTNCTFTSNSNPKAQGGAIRFDLQGGETGSLTITGSTFRNNTSLSVNEAGGAISVAITPGASVPSCTITKNTFENNSAPNSYGGAVSINNNQLGLTVAINYNRFVGNTASAAQAARSAVSIAGAAGNVNLSNNWWGCNSGPTGCADKGAINGSGFGTNTFEPYLQLKTTPTNASLCVTAPLNTTTITAGFTLNSANQPISIANLSTLIGQPISFASTLGTLSNSETTIQNNGLATATFTAGATSGTATVNASVDNVPTNEASPGRANLIINAPAIGVQPSNVIACTGTPISFTATASGSETGTIQWYKSATALTNGPTGTGSTIAISTSGLISILTITNPSSSDNATDYRAVFSSTGACSGTATSTNATLAISTPPTASLASSGTLTCASPSVTLTAGGGTSYTLTGGSGTQTNTTGQFVVSQAGSYTVTVTNAGGCTATATETVVNAVNADNALTWTGMTNTDWNTATNWCPSRLPLTTDDVVIPSGPANQPVLSTTAVAHSVEVQSGASLSITAAGNLTLNGSRDINNDNNTTAFYNGGLVDNSGQLIIGNTAAVGQHGIKNFGGTFNNHTGGEIRIDRSSKAGLFNYHPGTFTNEARLIIGANAGVGVDGIVIADGTFNNNTGGDISIDNVSGGGSHLLYNSGGTFINYARITLGIAGSTATFGIFNESGTINNSGCSALLNVVANAKIVNAGNFSNSGTIIENASTNSNIGTNSGIVQNLNGGTFNVGSGPNQPLSLSSTNASTCSPANGSITISGLHANTTYTLSYTVNGASSTVSPDPTSNANGQLTVGNLAAGAYALTLGGTCVPLPLSLSATLSGPASLTATLVSSGTLTCASPSVTLTASGGDVYQFSQGATQNGSDGSKATVTQQGVYSVTAISANGCSAVASTTVTSNTALSAPTLQASSLSTVNQPISVTASGCDGGTINWNPQGGTGTASGTVYTFTQPGNYTLSATCSVGSCISSASTPVTLQLIGVFTITSVTTVDCSPVSANRFLISFSPQYAGITGQPISFEVVNELLPTSAPGPYTLSLYTDNPILSLKAIQQGSPAPATYSYNWLAACQTTQNPNTAPQVVTPIPSQTAIVGQGFAYVIPANTFTDSETPLNLTVSAKGVPAGLSFSGAILSGTPSTTVGSPFSLTIIATDPGSLSVTTVLSLVVLPATTPVQPTAPFAITNVTTLSCTPIGNQINLTFSPQYTGQIGQAISFEVINELAPTTTPAPYSLNLYRDNPVIQLRATQSGSASPATFSYNWLAACTNLGQDNTPPRLNSPVGSQTAVVGQPFSLNLANTFIDQETPNQMTLSASGLPAGLSLVGTAISGTPSVSGVSTVSLTASDPGSLTASTSFVLTVSPAGSVFAISSVQTLSCITVSSGLRSVVFQPLYTGASSDPISFSVVNELAPTLAVGPYSLNLYTDNPIISLRAKQGNSVASYVYSWLAGCPSGARVGTIESGPGLQVRVLGNPVEGKTVEVEISGVKGQRVSLELVDLRGRRLDQQRIEQAAAVEQVKLEAGSLPSQFILYVSTATQRQVIKMLKP